MVALAKDGDESALNQLCRVHADRVRWMVRLQLGRELRPKLESMDLAQDDSWSEPRNLGRIVNSQYDDTGPDISSDGLMLFFDSRRPGGYGSRDTWATTRATTEDDWGVPVHLGPVVNTLYSDYTPCISEDGLILYLNIGLRMRQVSIAPSSESFQEASYDE